MTFERYNQLADELAVLSAAEIAEGWHFCPEFDQLLVGPGMAPWQEGICTCGRKGERDE